MCGSSCKQFFFVCVCLSSGKHFFCLLNAHNLFHRLQPLRTIYLRPLPPPPVKTIMVCPKVPVQNKRVHGGLRSRAIFLVDWILIPRLRGLDTPETKMAARKGRFSISTTFWEKQGAVCCFNQEAWCQETPLFSVKYLLEEANSASNFLEH